MKDLSQYYYWLFDLSKKYYNLRKIFLCITLILLSSSIYLKGYTLYSFSCFALILRTISCIYKIRIYELNSLAHDLQNIHIIAMATFRFQMDRVCIGWLSHGTYGNKGDEW